MDLHSLAKEGVFKDVLVSLLSVWDLARLAAVSRSLRAAVGALTSHDWMLSARSTHLPCDPIMRAPDCRQYLVKKKSVHDAIRKNQVQVVDYACSTVRRGLQQHLSNSCQLLALWEPEGRLIIQRFPEGPVNGEFLLPTNPADSNTKVLWAPGDARLVVWQASTITFCELSEARWQAATFPEGILSVVWSPAACQVAVVKGDGHIAVVDVHGTTRISCRLPRDDPEVCWSQSGDRLAWATDKQLGSSIVPRVDVWFLDASEVRHLYPNKPAGTGGCGTGMSDSVTFSPNSQSVVLPTGRLNFGMLSSLLLCRDVRHDTGLESVLVNMTVEWLRWGLRCWAVLFWSPRRGCHVFWLDRGVGGPGECDILPRSLDPGMSRVQDAAWSPDGWLLAVLGQTNKEARDLEVRVFHMKDTAPAFTYQLPDPDLMRWDRIRWSEAGDAICVRPLLEQRDLCLYFE